MKDTRPKILLDEIKALPRDKIDQEFLPYLDRINRLHHVSTAQCCIGHCKYGGVPKRHRPKRASKTWGYLSLFMRTTVVETLHQGQLLDNWAKDWLWVVGSQLFLSGANEPQRLEDVPGWGEITFAWDARFWPNPAEAITEALEQLV